MMSMRPFCEIQNPWDRGLNFMVGPIMPYSKNVLNIRQSSSLFFYKFEKNYMHDWGANEVVLSRNCEVHSPWVRDSGPRVDPIW